LGRCYPETSPSPFEKGNSQVPSPFEKGNSQVPPLKKGVRGILLLKKKRPVTYTGVFIFSRQPDNPGFPRDSRLCALTSLQVCHLRFVCVKGLFLATPRVYTIWRSLASAWHSPFKSSRFSTPPQINTPPGIPPRRWNS